MRATCGAFMDRLERLGARFILDPATGGVVLDAPAGALTADDRAALARRREAIRRLVRAAFLPAAPTDGTTRPIFGAAA